MDRPGRSAHRRVSRLILLCALAAGFTLASAQGASAALGWASSGAESASAGCVPCFDVAIVVVGTGHVSGVSPCVAEAGRIECAPATVDGQEYDCEEYFLWLDGDPTVVLVASGGSFRGWEPGNETSLGCPSPSGTQCTLTLDDTPLGTCVQATFDGSGTVGACPTSPPPPPGCSPNCGGGPPPPPVIPPPGGGGGGGTGVPSWTAACTITGSAGADTLRGTSGRNVICGRGGNDTIHGNGGNDLLRGEGGNDKLYGDAGIDRLDGGLGNDILTGGAGKDEARGGGGPDTFYAKDSIRDSLVGGPGTDKARVDRVDVLKTIERRF